MKDTLTSREIGQALAILAHLDACTKQGECPHMDALMRRPGARALRKAIRLGRLGFIGGEDNER